MIVLARFSASGQLDPSFGVDGVVRTESVSSSGEPLTLRPLALKVDGAAGRIVVIAGHESTLAVLQYRENGEADATFGQGGQQISGFFSGPGERGVIGGAVIDESVGIAVPVSLALDGPGAHRIVAVGRNDPFSSVKASIAVARYRFAGELDSTFSGDGKVVTELQGSSWGQHVCIDNTHGIVVVGPVFGPVTDRRFVIARYLPDGELDSTFSQNGFAVTRFPFGSAHAHAAAITGGRGVVAAGTFWERRNNPAEPFKAEFAVARYLPDGNLDTAFGDNGLVRTRFGDEAYATAVAIDGRNRVVAAGGNIEGFTVARYRSSDGALDGGFGTAGQLTADFGTGPPGALVLDLAMDLDDSIIAVGVAAGQWALARVREDGSLDPTFGSSGKIRIEIMPGQFGGATAVAVDNQQRITVAGDISDSSRSVFPLSRDQYLEYERMFASYRPAERVKK